MRTTVNLDDDVAAALDDLRRTRGLGLSEALNELARAGLVGRRAKAPFVARTARLGLRIDVSNVADALEALDGPSAR